MFLKQFSTKTFGLIKHTATNTQNIIQNQKVNYFLRINLGVCLYYLQFNVVIMNEQKKIKNNYNHSMEEQMYLHKIIPLLPFLFFQLWKKALFMFAYLIVFAEA